MGTKGICQKFSKVSTLASFQDKLTIEQTFQNFDLGDNSGRSLATNLLKGVLDAKKKPTHTYQKRPTHISKETYNVSKRDLHTYQRKPTHTSKETYHAKREEAEEEEEEEEEEDFPKP